MKKIYYLCTMILWLILFFTGEAFGLTTEEYVRGEIIDKVICHNETGQSYALYLPSSYKPGKSNPIIYAFDPLARGRLPLEHFKSAAERFGFIVVGSNNSENGNPEASAAAVRAMWSDTHERFSINDDRIYTAGFSGGARFAIRVGLILNGKIAGVIACGAGFPIDMNPSVETNFAFFGAAGISDFNFHELKEAEVKLEMLGLPRRVDTFEGAHEWLPSDLSVRALEWMELQFLKKDGKEKNSALIDKIFKSEMELANQYETSGKIYMAYNSYKQIIYDFRSIKDITELEKRVALLKDSEEVKQGLNQERDLDQQQKSYYIRMVSLRMSILSPQRNSFNESFGDNPSSNKLPDTDVEITKIPLTELQRLIAELKKKQQSKDNTFNNILARRILTQYFISTYEAAAALLREQKYGLAAASFALDAQLLPDNPQIHFYLACAHSQAGNKKKALAALKEAVKKGFNNLSRIEESAALNSIRNEEEFKKIVAGIKKGGN
jgi:hypothetical protein